MSGWQRQTQARRKQASDVFRRHSHKPRQCHHKRSHRTTQVTTFIDRICSECRYPFSLDMDRSPSTGFSLGLILGRFHIRPDRPSNTFYLRSVIYWCLLHTPEWKSIYVTYIKVHTKLLIGTFFLGSTILVQSDWKEWQISYPHLPIPLLRLIRPL
jgi:hypothetical protein